MCDLGDLSVFQNIWKSSVSTAFVIPGCNFIFIIFIYRTAAQQHKDEIIFSFTTTQSLLNVSWIDISRNMRVVYIVNNSCRRVGQMVRALLRGKKLNYKSIAKEISKPPFFGS